MRQLCRQFPVDYFRRIDEQRGYPDQFVQALTAAGWMAALIPPDYGGSGLTMAEASVIMEEINRCGGNSGACHGQMYVMNAIVRSGSEAQKQKYLPKIASGELRIQSMGVTEPTTGSDTTKLKTSAVKKDGRWVINGQKVWISRIQHSDLMILLARTRPADQVKKRSEGLSCFLIDLHQAIGNGLTVRPILNMVNHETNELFFDNLEIPEDALLGEEGKGFAYMMRELAWERMHVGIQAVSCCEAALEWTIDYTRNRKAFGKPVIDFQNSRFQLAEMKTEVQVGRIFLDRCLELVLDNRLDTTTAAMVKLWTSEMQGKVLDALLQLHGGYGFMWEYPITRAYADARVQRIYAGTNEIMKELIGRTL